MKHISFFLTCFFLSSVFSQIDSWEFTELSKGFKIKTPKEMQQRNVRDLKIFQIEGGNYDWKIISMSESSFTKDDPSVNFLGMVKNISNKLHQDPYTELLKDSLFLLRGAPIYYTWSKTTEVSDQSQNYHSFRFYILIEGEVYISNLKYFKESNLKFENFNGFFESMKIPKQKEELNLSLKGEKTYFEVANKKAFLNKVYCNYPKLEKSKSYHKLLSISVSLTLTESGKVTKVELDPSKMILITRESEAKMVEFFKGFTLKRAEKAKEIIIDNKFDFVLFLDEKSKKNLCK